MSALQILGVTLAVIAAVTFIIGARFLGDVAKGWPRASYHWIAFLEGAGFFWLVAALVGSGHRAVINAWTVVLAAVFAIAGLTLCAWLWTQRPRRAAR